jgi:hypothetical protein
MQHLTLNYKLQNFHKISKRAGQNINIQHLTLNLYLQNFKPHSLAIQNINVQH